MRDRRRDDRSDLCRERRAEPGIVRQGSHRRGQSYRLPASKKKAGCSCQRANGADVDRNGDDQIFGSVLGLFGLIGEFAGSPTGVVQSSLTGTLYIVSSRQSDYWW